MTLCRRVFRLIDAVGWVPPFVARLPLLFCHNAITEVLQGCDPDVVILKDIRWGNQLMSVLKRHFPNWGYSLNPEQPVVMERQWRRYDPSAKVSIVLPTYNGSKYIRQSIESCLSQSHKELELLIVDDGSREDIQEIVKDYSDSRIQYLRHPKNLGLAEALNTGFRNSAGAYLTWTSDDNYYAGNAIEEMVRFIQTYPEIDFVYTERYAKDERIPGQDWTIERVRVPASLEIDNFIGPCFLYKRAVYEAIGGYNPKTFLAEDYDYWVRVSKQFRMQFLYRPLYYFRYHRDSLTAKYPKVQVAEKVKLVKQINNMKDIGDRRD